MVFPSSETLVVTADLAPAALTSSRPEKAGATRSLKVTVIARGEATVARATGVEATTRAWASAWVATSSRALAAPTSERIFRGVILDLRNEKVQ